MVYAISDLHGQYQTFLKLLEIINFSANDELYIIGDIMDRGDNPIEIFQHIMDKPNIHFILGNHENMFLNSYEVDFSNWVYETKLWLSNGGITTLMEFQKLNKEEQDKIVKYIKNAPLCKKLEVNGQKFILAHASYCEEEFPEVLLWERPYGNLKLPENHILIFGHTRTKHFQSCIPMKIWTEKFDRMFGIDCGCAGGKGSTGQLGCLCLNNLNEFYAPIV